LAISADGPPGEDFGFEKVIRPLFRAEDRDEMLWAFDLWESGDVREHAGEILASVEDGRMPCDEAWPVESLEKLRGWIACGMPD
jgi:hypothetical protein